MSDAEFRRYRFDTAAQWKAAAIAGAALGKEGLHIPSRLQWTQVAGTTPADATAAIDFDPCGRLMWVRQESLCLFRLYEFGKQAQGRLAGEGRPRGLVANGTRLWLVDDHYLNRYAERNLQLLSVWPGERSVLAIASDRREGVWLLKGGDNEPASLAHLDCHGRLAHAEIKLRDALDQAVLATSRCGRFIVVLDRNARSLGRSSGCCRGGGAWTLLLIDACTRNVQILPGLFTREPFFAPSLIAIDDADHLHLVDARDGRLLTLSLSGDVLAETGLRLPDAALPLQGMTAKSSFAVAGATGILLAQPIVDDAPSDIDISAMVITPTLISQEGQSGGWQRADIDVLLPEGTTLTVTPATSRDPALAAAIAEIFADPTLSPAAKVEALGRQLDEAWEPSRSVVFAGTPGQARMRLHYALHEIEAPSLWLQLVLHVPPGRTAPSLRRLDVLYPNISYLEHLPAIYRRDSRSAAQLRCFLAVFEGLFGDLDELIEALPQSLDPATAPDEWLPLLLGWLGFPAMPGLLPTRRRALLERAADLLVRRGTIGALEDLLRVVTAREVSVEDASAGPPPWVLPPHDGAGEPPRLGRDTLILTCGAPRPFALGWSATLGKVPLSQGCQPGSSAFARQSESLTIRIAAPPSEREHLAPLLAALLPHFVPAHCRYRIVYERAGVLPQHRRLDRDLRLAGQREMVLGADFILGHRRLPAQSAGGAIIGRTSDLDGRLYLC